MHVKKHPFSIAVRMMSIIGVVTVAALVLFAVTVINAVEEHFAELDEVRLEEIHATFVSDGRSPSEAAAHIEREHPDAGVVLMRDGRIVVRTKGAPAGFSAASAPDGLFTFTQGERTWRGRRTEEVGGGSLYCFVPMDVHLAFHEVLYVRLAIALLLLTLAVFAVVWWTVRRGMAPVEELSRRMNSMRADRIEPAFDEARVPRELTGFVTAFNKLLGRLSDVLSRQKHFSADIAHELKTPVTNLTVQTEVALSRPRSTEELENILYSSLEEYRRLSKMIEDMLFLARIDNAAQRLERETFELKADVADLVDFFSDWADEKGVGIDVLGENVLVNADRLMVRRAVTNLITNAAKHTAPGGRVLIFVKDVMEKGVRAAKILVSNPGEPIPAEHLPHLFDRFYRADASRNRQDGGTGIGLAMVASIVRLHGGEVAVTSDHEATVFSFTLPTGGVKA